MAVASTRPARAPGARAMRFALVVWVLLLAVIAASEPTLASRPAQFLVHLAWLLWPSALLPLLLTLLTWPLPRRLRDFGRSAAFVVFGIIGLLWLPLVGLAAWLLPTPFAVVPWIMHEAEFRARHPQLKLVTWESYDVEDATGRRVRIDPLDMAAEGFRFEDCPAALGPERLGGLEPPAGARCAFSLRFTVRGHEHLRHVFRLEARQRDDGVAAHFEAWARARGVDTGGSFTGASYRKIERIRYAQTITLYDARRTWRVQVYRRGHEVWIHIPEGGAWAPYV